MEIQKDEKTKIEKETDRQTNGDREDRESEGK